MDYMTKLEGVPSTDDAKPGMAHFAGTGPYGETCGKCKHRGLTRQSQNSTWSERLQQNVHKHYRTAQCAMFKKLAGEYGSAVRKDYPACKYFEAREPKKRKTPEPA